MIQKNVGYCQAVDIRMLHDPFVLSAPFLGVQVSTFTNIDHVFRVLCALSCHVFRVLCAVVCHVLLVCHVFRPPPCSGRYCVLQTLHAVFAVGQLIFFLCKCDILEDTAAAMKVNRTNADLIFK
jgi:hypothetical protein